MRARLKTGPRSDVLRRMAEHAIRDQVALADAYANAAYPNFGEPDAEALRVIDECRRNIADYRVIATPPTTDPA